MEFNPLAAQRYVLGRQGYSSSVCQAVVGATRASTAKSYQQCQQELAGWCTWGSETNNAISAPKLADLLVHLFRVCLAWHTIGTYSYTISALLECHHNQKASNYPILSKLMHHCYLQCPSSVNILIHGILNIYYFC